MATCLSWAKPSEQPLHLIWWVKRTLHSRGLLRATLAWSHGPSPPQPHPPPPHTHTHTHTNGELARRLSSLNKRQWSQEWILSFLIHETGLIEKPSYNRNLNRALLINLRQPRWRYKKCCWMPPYLTVSHTSLSSEAHRPTPRHGQYITHALIILAVAAMDSCFIAALEKTKQKTICIKHHLQMFMLVDSCYFDIRCLRRL